MKKNTMEIQVSVKGGNIKKTYSTNVENFTNTNINGLCLEVFSAVTKNLRPISEMNPIGCTIKTDYIEGDPK